MQTQSADDVRTKKRFHTPQNLTPDIATLPADALLTRQQMAALSGYKEHVFKKWAREGRGPKITVVEGRPRFRVADARAWLGAV